MQLSFSPPALGYVALIIFMINNSMQIFFFLFPGAEKIHKKRLLVWFQSHHNIGIFPLMSIYININEKLHYLGPNWGSIW